MNGNMQLLYSVCVKREGAEKRKEKRRAERENEMEKVFPSISCIRETRDLRLETRNWRLESWDCYCVKKLVFWILENWNGGILGRLRRVQSTECSSMILKMCEKILILKIVSCAITAKDVYIVHCNVQCTVYSTLCICISTEFFILSLDPILCIRYAVFGVWCWVCDAVY